MVEGFAKTPRYVLKEGAAPTRPSIVASSLGTPASVIYGFSDKPEYDVFQSHSSLALTPYPLVKGFLKNQIEQDADALKLFVLDAVSSSEPRLYAAAFQAILEAFQVDGAQVAISHQLVLQDASQGYQIQAVALSSHAEPMS